MARSMIKIIVNEVQKSQYFSTSVDSTLDITHTCQLWLTLKYILWSGQFERFTNFVPIKSHIGLGIAEIILFFLQKNSIDIKYYCGQSYGNASNMPGT